MIKLVSHHLELICYMCIVLIKVYCLLSIYMIKEAFKVFPPNQWRIVCQNKILFYVIIFHTKLGQQFTHGGELIIGILS